MIALALALPAVAAVLVARLVWPAPPVRPAAFRWFQAFAAAGAGLALSSCAFFLWYPVFGHPKHHYAAAEAVACAAVIVAAVVRLKRAAPTPAADEPSGPRWLWVPFAASVAVAAHYLAKYWDRDPFGHWDAIAIWNLRARFLFRTGADWADSFTPLNLHTDYPLFVPATIARAWCYAGAESGAAPVAVAVLMLALAAGALVAGVNHLRGGGQGWLAGAVLLAAFPFVQTTGFQYADTPLSFFVLAAVAVLVVHDHSGGTSRTPPVVAGALAGFAAWTKNEGQLAFVALALCRAVVLARRKSPREMVWFFTGAVPGLVALAVLKFEYAPPNDLVAGQGGDTLGRLTDAGRYAQISVAAAEQLWAFGPGLLLALAGYALLVGRAKRRVPGTGMAWAVLAVVAAGYAAVYLTTPHDLAWHLNTSLVRLVVQVWPLFLFALFVTTETAKA